MAEKARYSILQRQDDNIVCNSCGVLVPSGWVTNHDAHHRRIAAFEEAVRKLVEAAELLKGLFDV